MQVFTSKVRGCYIAETVAFRRKNRRYTANFLKATRYGGTGTVTRDILLFGVVMSNMRVCCLKAAVYSSDIAEYARKRSTDVL